MKASAGRLLAPLLVLSFWACGDPSGTLAPATMATARVGDWTNPGPAVAGVVGQLSGISDLLQVNDARLTAVEAALLQYPPDPGRPLADALVGIRTTAQSLTERVTEMERLVGVGFPPSPVKPPNPNSPPDPCRAVIAALPPDPCYAGQLGSIGNALVGADGRMAAIQGGFLPPPDADLPAVQDALARINAAAMDLARTASAMLERIGQ